MTTQTHFGDWMVQRGGQIDTLLKFETTKSWTDVTSFTDDQIRILIKALEGDGRLCMSHAEALTILYSTGTKCPACGKPSRLTHHQTEWYESHGLPGPGERFSDEWWECQSCGCTLLAEEIEESNRPPQASNRGRS